MYKSFIGYAGLGIVVLSSLVSCTKENNVHTQNVYRAPIPILTIQGKKISLKAFDAQSIRQLDLRDTVDFSQSGSVQLTLNSRCRIGEREFVATEDFKGAPNLALYKFLPEDVLIHDFTNTETKVGCSLEMKLFNGAGSNHTFNLPFVPFTDLTQGGVQMAHEPPSNLPGQRLKTDMQDIRSLRLRYGNQATSSVHLICTDMTLSALPFDQVLDLSLFNLGAPIMRDSRPRDILEESPFQLCRAVITQAGKRVEVSDLFQLALDRGPLPVYISSYTWRAADASQMSVGLQNLKNGASVLLMEWQLTNPNPYRRYIRFQKRYFNVKFNFYFNLDGQLYNRAATHARLGFGPVLTPKHIIHDGGDLIVELQPYQNLAMQASFNPTGTIKCEPLGVIFHPTETIPIDELTKSGKLISHMDLTLEGPIIIAPNQNPILLLGTPERYGPCSWP